MDMWNWLLDCYKEGSLTVSEMENVLVDDREAEKLWEDFSTYKCDFVEFVREEIKPFLTYARDLEFDERIKKAKPK